MYVKTYMQATRNEGSILAKGTVILDQILVIKNVYLMNGPNGAYLSFPRYKQTVGNSIEYYSLIELLSEKDAAEILHAVMLDVAYQNVSDKLPEIQVTEIKLYKKGSMLASANIEIGNIKINKIKILKGNKGLYIRMPQYENERKDTIYPCTRKLREKIKEKILVEYEKIRTGKQSDN